jgi:ABC-type bacteriocin/lantibiotic exporter with double-glycine peptidase domain
LFLSQVQLQPFWQYIRGRKNQLILLQVLMILTPFLGSVSFLLVIPLLDLSVTPIDSHNEQLNQLLQLLPVFMTVPGVLLMFFGLTLLAATSNYARTVIAEKINGRVVLAIREDLYRLMMTAEWRYLSKTHSADYTRIVAEEVESVSSLLDQLQQLISLFFQVSIYCILCVYLAPQLTLIAIGLGLMLLAITSPLQRFIVALGNQQLIENSRLFRLTTEQIRGLKDIKSSAVEEPHTERFKLTAGTLFKVDLRYGQLSARSRFLHVVVSALVFCALAYVALTQFDSDIATLGVVALVFSRLLPQISQFQVYFQRIGYLQATLQSISALLENLKFHQEERNTTDFSLSNCDMTLRGISFQYPQTDRRVLSNFNAQLSMHQMIAIAGQSGIGKSTLADIIAGINLPDEGEFRVGDTLITAANVKSWRRNVSYLPQTPFIIEASVRDNLNLLLNEARSDAELTAAIKLANAEVLIEAAGGLNSIISDNGQSLSGGEKQKLQLARLFLDPKPVVILDETTGNLDLSSEKNILNSIRHLKDNRLIILISHRPSVIDYADQVITLDIQE